MQEILTGFQDATFFDHVVNGEPFYDVAEDYLGKTRSLPRLESLSSLASLESVYDKYSQVESEEDRKAKEQALEVEEAKNRGKWVKALGALYREELRAVGSVHSRRSHIEYSNAPPSIMSEGSNSGSSALRSQSSLLRWTVICTVGGNRRGLSGRESVSDYWKRIRRRTSMYTGTWCQIGTPMMTSVLRRGAGRIERTPSARR